MVGGIDRGHQLLVERAVGPVVVRLALLVLDDVPLVVEVLLRERIEQRAHPIGLEPQAELDLVGRQRLEVVRAVEERRRVADAASTLDEGHVLGLRDVAAALEHEVLEEVGEAGLAGLLVLRADVVPEVDRDDRGDPIGSDDDAEAVVEGALAEADVRALAHDGSAVTDEGMGSS